MAQGWFQTPLDWSAPLCFLKPNGLKSPTLISKIYGLNGPVFNLWTEEPSPGFKNLKAEGPQFDLNDQFFAKNCQCDFHTSFMWGFSAHIMWCAVVWRLKKSIWHICMWARRASQHMLCVAPFDLCMWDVLFSTCCALRRGAVFEEKMDLCMWANALVSTCYVLQRGVVL